MARCIIILADLYQTFEQVCQLISNCDDSLQIGYAVVVMEHCTERNIVYALEDFESCFGLCSRVIVFYNGPDETRLANSRGGHWLIFNIIDVIKNIKP
jgi:hypothetical protein